MKKLLKCVLALSLATALLAGCTTKSKNEETPFTVSMIADVGGINDQSFNQSAWEGLQKLKGGHAIEVSFLEANQEAEYGPHASRMVDDKTDLIWGVGFRMGDAIESTARMNPDRLFAIVDFAYDNSPENIIGVVFKAEEPSFLVGYMAALTTQSDKVGFIGGIRGNIIDQFEYGYRAGVEYAAKELGKDIEVVVQYADSFGDVAAGRAIATVMYAEGADIIFHAAGGVGLGVIEAAVEMDKLVIGVDRDQSDLAPNHVMTSALKLVGQAMYDVSLRVFNGEELGGQTLVFGITEKGVGIPDYAGSTANLVSREAYDRTMGVQDSILNGDIVVPYNEVTFINFLNSL